MPIEVSKVSLESDVDLATVADEVSVDKRPRVLERDGKAVAAIVSMEDLERVLLGGPTPDGIRRALEAAGSLSDEEGEALKERVYRWRHESPPSRPVKW